MKNNIELLIPTIDIEKISNKQKLWDFHISCKKVNPLNKPCKDCAVTTGFYLDYAEALGKESIDVQNAVSSTWYCHNNCNRGCAGIVEYLIEINKTNNYDK